MPANFTTGVPSLDPIDLKQGLKEFLGGQEEFNSHNFDASALSTLLDLLTKNTHYLAYIANMQARESFLQRAQLRENVVEHAQKLSYVPGSKTCSKAVLSVVVTPAEGTLVYPPFITMSPNTVFAGQYASEPVIFTTRDGYALYLNTDNNTYSRSGVEVLQGDYIQESFVYNSIDRASFVLTNPNIDTSTIQVSVENSVGDSRTNVFHKVTDITEVGPTSPIFFIYEASNGQYRLEFGDDVLGKALFNGNVVKVTYMATNSETIANGLSAMSLISDVEGFVDAEVTVTTDSYGGSDREDIEQIRRWAPLGWEAQGRSVTTTDYTVNLKRLFPQAKSAVCWGGEENEPPRNGSVFLAVNTQDGSLLVASVKQEIKRLLKSTNVGAITPEIVDPEYIDLYLTVSVGYDAIKSKLSISDEFKAISSLCIQFSKGSLEDFDRHFVSSDLTTLIKNRDAVISADVTARMSKRIELAMNVLGYYTVKFNNPIQAGSVEIRGFSIYPTDVDARLYDNGLGQLKIDRNDNGTRKVIVDNAGTVNYTAGEVKFNMTPIATADRDSNVNIYATPTESNLLALRQDIVRISTVNVVENIKLRRG